MVTLGIIGVVSAMTVPTLMQNYQRDSYTTQLHKVYNEVSQAMLRVITESNAVSLRESNFSKNGAGWFLRTYFKTVKTCEYADLSSCFASDYQNMGGSSITLSNTVPNTSSCAVIASGASICMTTNVVVVDINGKQGPNILDVICSHLELLMMVLLILLMLKQKLIVSVQSVLLQLQIMKAIVLLKS